MPFIEAPTNFYLGRRYDPSTQRVTQDVVYYDSRDLVTHAVVVGMTGSGKTGLCINLLEEAALDNIPAIIIDPKGDITNLLLNFPDLNPQDFQNWINMDDAARAGMDIPNYAADVAQRWREGLASWGIVQDRMRWLKYAAHYSIYTPGSDAGLPVSILASLRAPREGWEANEEAHREKINAIVTALLALVGRNAQPVVDKEHVLVSNIFEYAWRRGQDLTLEDVIINVQKPPFDKLGVFPIDKYITERVRQKLAMDLNNIVAAPSFESWLNGDPMDIQSLLYLPDGRPRVSIFYTAHMNDSERQFITTLLLENMLGWMRSQSGTTSLRAILYIDEMFGYFPPYPSNPPTKEPILRLLKQARAFGLGLILATQNPGDLDYKGLSNAGTWFIGRLQSEQDRQRVMAGLESLASVSTEMNLRDVRQLISDIPPRVFLMHNVHDRGGPVMLHTRWAMSYLRGPLTRQQIGILMADQKAKLGLSTRAAVAAAFNTQQAAPQGYVNYYPTQSAPQTQGFPLPPQHFAPQVQPGSAWGVQTAAPPPPMGLPEAPSSFPEQPTQPYSAPNFNTQQFNSQPLNTQPINQTGATKLRSGNAPSGYSANPPPLSASVPQYFIPNEITADQALRNWEMRTGFTAQGYEGVTLAYRPVLLAQTTIRYSDRKTSIYTARTYNYRIPNVDRAGLTHWDEHVADPIDPRRVGGEPLSAAIFGDLSPGLTDSKRMTALKNELVDMLYTTARLSVPFNPTLGIYANPDRDYSEFRAQAQQIAREKRDQEVDAMTKKFEAVLDKLETDMRSKIQRLDSEKRELANTKREELFTTGEAILGLLKGRTSFTLSRMSRASVYKARSKGQVEQFELGIEEIERDVVKTQEEFEASLNAVNEKWARIATQSEEYIISAYKKDIVIDLFGIGWIPSWYTIVNGQAVLLPALNETPRQ